MASLRMKKRTNKCRNLWSQHFARLSEMKNLMINFSQEQKMNALKNPERYLPCVGNKLQQPAIPWYKLISIQKSSTALS